LERVKAIEPLVIGSESCRCRNLIKLIAAKQILFGHSGINELAGDCKNISRGPSPDAVPSHRAGPDRSSSRSARPTAVTQVELASAIGASKVSKQTICFWERSEIFEI
jgi:hypothetical protein